MSKGNKNKTATSINVMVVEDDPDAQEFFRRMLASGGYNASIVGGVRELTNCLETQCPDICFLDLSLEDGDGVSALDVLSDFGFVGSVILMSAFGDKVLRSANRIGKSLGLKMQRPLVKPFQISQVRHLLEKCRQSDQAISAEDFLSALNNNELELFYQPQVHIATNAVSGAEALIRWRHPKRGVLTPGVFAHLLEHNDVTYPLTDFVIEQANLDRARLLAKGMDLQISVNTPASIVSDRSICDLITSKLRKHSMNAEKLIVEITESAAFSDPSAAEKMLTRLRILGCGLSIDDFGTGFSSLLQLYKMPFSELKIDQSFISEIDKEDEARTITAAIIALGKAIGLDIVAEGIETESQRQILQELDCQIVQGYLFSKPVTLNELECYVSQHGQLSVA